MVPGTLSKYSPHNLQQSLTGNILSVIFRTYQSRPASRSLPGHYIHFAIAYYPAVAQINVEILRSLYQHPRLRLSAVTFNLEFRHLTFIAFVRMMRTVIQSVNVCAFCSKQGFQLIMNSPQFLGCHFSPGYYRLIGHNDCKIP